MPNSQLEVYNQALSAAGVRAAVSSLTENSREAEVCGVWYETIRDQILRAAFWPSTKKWQRLALLAERDFSADWINTDPGPQWKFAYALPSDMLAPRYLSTYGRFALELYAPEDGDEVMALMTDHEEALLQYSKRQTTVSIWDDSLALAIVNGLAAAIAIPLTGKLDLANYLAGVANNQISIARQNSANVDTEQYDVIPDWIAKRGYADQGPATKFLFPYGPALSISSEPGPVLR